MSWRRRLVPYWLLGPGLLWLLLFFVVPMYFMGELALRSGTLTTGYSFDWAWSNFPDSLSGHTEQIGRSFVSSVGRPPARTRWVESSYITGRTLRPKRPPKRDLGQLKSLIRSQSS